MTGGSSAGSQRFLENFPPPGSRFQQREFLSEEKNEAFCTRIGARNRCGYRYSFNQYGRGLVGRWSVEQQWLGGHGR